MQEDVKTPSMASTDAALHAFVRLVTLGESISFELWKTHGLTLGQVRLLKKIRDNPMVAGDLAKELGVLATSLTRMMERLQSNGLIERHLDRTDRRRIMVELTPLGKETLGNVNVFRKGPITAALESMSEDDRQQFSTALEKFLDTLSEQDINP